MYITSEYVSLGHPDKTADYISEYLLDQYLKEDPNVRYAVECQVKDNVVNLAGEVTSTYKPTDEQIKSFVVKAVEDIGYTEGYAKKWDNQCINPAKLQVNCFISQQSPEISVGVDREGWGDQGIFFGYAMCNSNTNYMPIDYTIAKDINTVLYEAAKQGRIDAGLDIKTQVTMDEKDGEYLLDHVIVAIPLLVNDDSDVEDVTNAAVEDAVYSCIKKYIDNKLISGYTDSFRVTINGTGCYKIHSSVGDCGTTGRKLAVDFYGGNSRIGGGSPWTKDGTKADLTLNLYARKLAVDYAKQSKQGDVIETRLSCCIGRKTVNICVLKNGKEMDNYQKDLSTSQLIQMFDLHEPHYADMCRYGLFSRVS